MLRLFPVFPFKKTGIAASEIAAGFWKLGGLPDYVEFRSGTEQGSLEYYHYFQQRMSRAVKTPIGDIVEKSHLDFE
ncbi:MAG: hypothetical protein ACYSWO_06295 [Planctomycetota bacterium]